MRGGSYMSSTEKVESQSLRILLFLSVGKQSYIFITTYTSLNGSKCCAARRERRAYHRGCERLDPVTVLILV